MTAVKLATYRVLEDLVSQGFMMAVELTTCRVLEDPASSTPMGGYVVACAAFYERGFSVPSHQFLCSVLQYYGLELHHMTTLGILHIMVFVTLCESYMGIEPHFELWSHFFRVRLSQGSGCGSSSFEWHGHLCQIWAWSRSLLLSPYVRIHGRMPESMVLSKE
jgi:hypothetical protein